MRSLDECRAEVFARSKKRIEKRRRIRRSVAAGLAPLCLCMALFAILPKMAPSEQYECMPEAPENKGYSGEPESDAADTSQPLALVIRTDGNCWMLSEDQTELLAQRLDSYLTAGKPAESQREADYEIELLTAEGAMTRYFLSGSYLTCDGKTAKLSEPELQQLLELLQPESE